MSPMRVQHRLETWRAAERERQRLDGTPGHTSAEAANIEAREAYLDAVRVLAEGSGTSGIDRVPGAVAGTSAGEASMVRSAAVSLQRGATADQRASDSDQVVSDADQRESDADLVAARGGRPLGETQAFRDLRRLANSALRDANAAARDTNADERDALIDKLDGIQRPNGATVGISPR